MKTITMGENPKHYGVKIHLKENNHPNIPSIE